MTPFQLALENLLTAIRKSATDQFDYNKRVNIPKGIMWADDSIEMALQTGVAHAINSIHAWDCEQAIAYAHTILQDCNCDAAAAALREL